MDSGIRTATWLQAWEDLGRAPRTLDAYARGLAEYLALFEREGVDPLAAGRAHVGVFVRELTSRPHRRGANVVSITSGAGLASATVQQRLVPVRLFYDFLMEEGCVHRTRWAAGGTRRADAAALSSGALCPAFPNCRGSPTNSSGGIFWMWHGLSRCATG
ncbi:site-specific integrase [Streptomyces sp. NBC_00268]|nr:site-specific integrase [Streptomyces sp. NBC_01764]MCX5181547.1 site-specific integrase [Streptomyces sp. NBC_00268]